MKLGVCYYPEHWPRAQWHKDAARMRELGLEVVRMGEFAWSRFEPEPGQYHWAWMLEAMDIVHRQGLRVVLGTPTACPPKWLVDRHPEILPVDEEGRTKGFGSRRHYCFSSTVYRQHCQRVISKMAEALGQHPALVAWQTDNEYGCHDSIFSYSEAAREAFQHWCQRQYGEIEALNRAWGNAFWSMSYRHFQEVDPPSMAVTELNPAHRMAYWRFHSDQVADFNRLQVDILRQHSPGRALLHNYMGETTSFDHRPVAADLDIATWDSYPLGFLEQSRASEHHKNTYMRTGDPDFTAFHHDLYRGLGRGRWWVMEQQPGPVNWAPHNPVPLPGMVRFWTWEAFAHGAELVSYFRFRQCPFAQEQMHAGLHLPNGEPDVAAEEVQQVLGERRALVNLDVQHAPATVALVFDYASDAALRIQPQGVLTDPLDEVLRWYRALRRLAVDVDVLGPEADLRHYTCVILPSQVFVDETLKARLRAHTGSKIFGPRSASKSRELSIPEGLAGSDLSEWLALRVCRVESLRAGARVGVEGQRFFVRQWREQVQSTLAPHWRCEDGWGLWYQQQSAHYLAAQLDDRGLSHFLEQVLKPAGVPTQQLPKGLRMRKLGALQFVFNYGPEAVTLAPVGELLLGQRTLAAGQLAAWRTDADSHQTGERDETLEAQSV